MLRIAAEATLITSRISNPSFTSNCVEQTGSIDIREDSSAEDIIPAVGAVRPLSVVERVIENLSGIDMRSPCRGESFVKGDVVREVVGGRSRRLRHGASQNQEEDRS